MPVENRFRIAIAREESVLCNLPQKVIARRYRIEQDVQLQILGHAHRSHRQAQVVGQSPDGPERGPGLVDRAGSHRHAPGDVEPEGRERADEGGHRVGLTTGPPGIGREGHLDEDRRAGTGPGDALTIDRARHRLPAVDAAGQRSDLVALRPAQEVPPQPRGGTSVEGGRLGFELLCVVLADLEEPDIARGEHRFGAKPLGHGEHRHGPWIAAGPFDPVLDRREARRDARVEVGIPNLAHIVRASGARFAATAPLPEEGGNVEVVVTELDLFVLAVGEDVDRRRVAPRAEHARTGVRALATRAADDCAAELCYRKTVVPKLVQGEAGALNRSGPGK